MAAADALDAAGQVEHERRGGQAAGQRRGREDDQADGVDAPAAEDVADHAGGEQEGGQGQGVGVDHPLEIGEGGVERLLDVGERHVDHGDVQQQHEGAGADGDQRPPLAVHHHPFRSDVASRSHAGVRRSTGRSVHGHGHVETDAGAARQRPGARPSGTGV